MPVIINWIAANPKIARFAIGAVLAATLLISFAAWRGCGAFKQNMRRTENVEEQPKKANLPAACDYRDYIRRMQNDRGAPCENGK